MSHRATTEPGAAPASWLNWPSAGPRTATPAIHDAAVLGAILPYALAQAKRHHEPISLFCVAVDRLPTIQALHGPEIAGALTRLTAATVRGMLRSSDFVAWLEEGRLIVLLPNAGLADAVRLAETARTAITEAAAEAARDLPPLTVSIGVANSPAHAQDAHALVAVASQAATRAEEQGRDQVVVASPAPLGSRLAGAACAN